MIFVDSAFIPAQISRYRPARWSHLMSDDIDPVELHAFAVSIGLSTTWFQHKPSRPEHDHYDVTMTKRKLALSRGAVLIGPTQLVELINLRRAKLRELHGQV
jgi:Protein of unknown function (DUF4031)